MRQETKKLKTMGVSKEIEDYLHLYLGCECEANDGTTGILVSCHLDSSAIRIGQKTSPMNGGWVFRKEEVKLILRPLSDMTEEEALEAGNMLGGLSHLSNESIIAQSLELLATNKIYNHQTNIPGIKWIRISAYLLSKYFDLFGLIESGLAIDKTKTQKP